MPVSKITKTSVLRQSQKPSNPEPGLIWYDTQAEVLKQFKNGSFENVGNSIDGKTITKNQNGELKVNIDGDSIGKNSNDELEVRKPSFEDINFSSISVSATGDGNMDSQTTSVSHNANTILLEYEVDTTGGNTGANIDVNGTRVFSRGDNSESGSIIVSNATGNDTISIEAYGDDEGFGTGQETVTISVNGVKVKNGVHRL